MTEAQLIELLDRKPLVPLTPEILDGIRGLWNESSAIRRAFGRHLQLQPQEIAALGMFARKVDVKGYDTHSVDALLAEATARALAVQADSRRFHFRLSGLPLATVLAMLFGLVGVVWWLGRPPQEVVRPGRPDPDQVQPHDEQKSPTTEPGAQNVATTNTTNPGNDLTSQQAAWPEFSTEDAVSALEVLVGIRQSEPPSATPKAPAPVIEPWTAALSREIAPWPALSPRFIRDFKGAGHDQLSEVDAKRWFVPVEGLPFSIAQDVYGVQQTRAARFNGFARLKAPWTEDALLRLTPFDVSSLTIYLWSGQKGLALRFFAHRDPHTWSAHVIERDKLTPKPDRWGLVASDNGAHVRSGLGTIDLRHQNGSLVLARGNVPLMTAPLERVPEEVFFEGQFRLRGISIHKTAPLPSLPENPRPVVLTSLPKQAPGEAVVSVPPLDSHGAASLPWSVSTEMPAGVTKNTNGSVALTTNSPTNLGVASVPLPARGLYEVIARVESADPGTGLFLGDLDGRPTHQIGFFKDGATGRTVFGVLRPGERRDTAQFDPNGFAPPYHLPVTWIKVVSGCGTMQVLVSGDRQHWGHLIENPARDLPGAIGSVGLYGLPHTANRSITLSHLEVRELSGLTDLADRALVARTARFGPDDWKDVPRWKDLTNWMHRVVETCPSGVDLPQWTTASAIGTLSQGPPREFAMALLRRTVSMGIRSNASLGEKLRLLEDAALLGDFLDEAAVKSFALHYEQLVDQLALAGDPHPLETIRPALIRSPLWTVSKLRFVWEKANSRELLAAAYRQDWPDALRTSQLALYWNSGPHPDWKPTDKSEDVDRHARWLKQLTLEKEPKLDDGSGAIPFAAWRHPLSLQWNKEAYNVRSELQSALVGRTYEDACRIVMAIGEQSFREDSAVITPAPAGAASAPTTNTAGVSSNAHESFGAGLLPDIEDRDLFVSLPTAVSIAMHEHPEFAKTMNEKFGPLGLIRVKQAVQIGDARAMAAATIQFQGTEAAVEAHRWLGDRELAAGRFQAAEDHFMTGLSHASLLQQEALVARLRLTQALNGKGAANPPRPLTTGLELGSRKLTPPDFETVMKELVGRPTTTSPYAVAADRVATAVAATTDLKLKEGLPVAAYKLEARANFDGQPGLNPERAEFKHGDPFGRQLAVAVDDQRLYVSNRFQVNAYPLAGGQQVWAQGLGAEQGESHAFPFMPMKPLLAGDRLFVRRLTKAGIELACLKSADGAVIWNQRPNLHVLTDPVFWNGNLFAVTVSKADEGLLQVEGTWFDAEAGTPTSSRPLFRMRESTDRALIAALALVDRTALVSVGGTTACIDGSGNVRWLRRHVWMPKVVDELSEDFRSTFLHVAGERAIVALPGVRGVTALNRTSGRRLWERPIGDLRGVLAVAGSRLLVETTRGLIALSLEDGSFLWSRSIDTRLEAFQVNERTVIVGQRCGQTPLKTRPFLAWLDLATGRELHHSQLDGAERDENQFGPLFPAANKWWSFAGTGWKDPKRELNELVPQGSFVPGPFADQILSPWSLEAQESQLADLALVLPGWCPAAEYKGRIQLATGDMRGETHSVMTKLMPEDRELRLFQQVKLPAGRKAALKLRYGTQAAKKWTLEVRVNDHLLLEQSVDDAVATNGWRDSTIGLSPFAGQTVLLQLTHRPEKPLPNEAYWKQAVVVIE